jgi:hypothetical protein
MQTCQATCVAYLGCSTGINGNSPSVYCANSWCEFALLDSSHKYQDQYNDKYKT